MPSEENRFERGDIVDERFEIAGVLGEGGMGTVYRAIHLMLQQEIALKILRRPDPLARQRFEREARVHARLKHPNAVQLMDFGNHNDVLYIAMEMLEGESLRSRLRREGQLPIDEVMELTVQLADVLQAAHQMTLIHRDLKPENILLCPSDELPFRAVVLDFGLAFLSDVGDDLGRLTREGVVAGTPHYISPEGAIGVSELDPRSDLYSLGCLLYESLCGQAPFHDKSSVKLLNMHLFQPVQAPSLRCPDLSIPAAFEDLLLELLAKDYELRPQASQLLARMQAMLTGEESPARGRGKLAPRAQRALDTQQIDEHHRPTSIIEMASTHSDLPRTTLGLFEVSIDDGYIIALRASGFRLQKLHDTTPVDPMPPLIFAPRASPEAIEELSAHSLVLSSAQPGDPDRLQEVLRAGAEDVVLEPLRLDDLLRKVQRLRRRLQRRKEDG